MIVFCVIEIDIVEQEGGGAKGDKFYRGGNFARKCISTTPIGAAYYILARAAIPPAPQLPLKLNFIYELFG